MGVDNFDMSVTCSWRGQHVKKKMDEDELIFEAFSCGEEEKKKQIKEGKKSEQKKCLE